MQSRLCAGSDPVTVARALCEACAADTLYVADLDALLGHEMQAGVLASLIEALPEVAVWVDAGFGEPAEARALQARLGALGERLVPVFGSESLRSRDALREVGASGSTAGGVLSLDRRDGQPLDRAGCWQAPHLWPARVIMMTLERVGADAGPDLITLHRLAAQAPGVRFIGAGGLRDEADREAARQAGAAAWLVASALHAGRLARAGTARNAT